MPLTDTQCRSARTPEGKKSIKLPDGGGLYLKVFSGGAKTWFFRLRVDGRDQMMRLGSYPSMGLLHARREANQLTAMQRDGIDPIQARQDAESAAREAQEQAKREAERLATRLTGENLIKQWVKLDLSGRKDGGDETIRGFRLDVLPVIGKKFADEICKADIIKIIDRISERGADRLANRTLADLRQMFRWAAMRDMVVIDPTYGLKKRTRETERERALSEAEIVELAGALPSARLPAYAVSAVWIMLSTLCRVGELSVARWRDIDLEQGEWLIPEPKNGRAHTVLLPNFAVAEFMKLKDLADGSEWVLPGRGDGIHIDEKTLARAVKDRQRERAIRGRIAGNNALLLSGGPWTPHDLRRSGATLMVDLGIRPDVIERCLNHVEQNRMKRVYQRSEMVPEKKRAWAVLGDTLARLRDGVVNDDGKVIEIRRAG